MYTKIFKIVTILSLLVVGGGFLTSCAGRSAGGNTPVDVNVTLTEFKIQSSLTDFKVGVPYHFIVENKGTVAHSFLIMPPTTEQITPEQAMQTTALAGLVDSDLPAGATKTLDYTFTKAYPAGTLEFACHSPGHYEAGMHTPITVK